MEEEREKRLEEGWGVWKRGMDGRGEGEEEGWRGGMSVLKRGMDRRGEGEEEGWSGREGGVEKRNEG
ncbi:hypothetical protein Pmani_000391 [Petrolisthes manimaculis]|uniref:Uncharacterized protein n=1 Tax=Petrolisthes manimaculis TaxID=1843537 RepID=A0AAE1UME9_9EUCA|nr:hypothetical protein Pmani_000391 [Petrolisthes manimaculis]